MKSNTRYSGFTLIEIMIVIGIIALLAALTLGISSSVMRNSEKRKTQNVLQLLTVALQEWEIEKGRSITFEGAAFAADSDSTPISIGELEVQINVQVLYGLE